jgi:hypothetical protein
MTRRRPGRSAKETRELKAQLRALLMSGATEHECIEELGIRVDHLRWLKTQLLADELQEVVNDTPDQVWAKYRMRQEGCIKDLDEIVSEAKHGKIPLNTAVGAIKAKAAIIDSILVRGQELGVLYKEPERQETKSTVRVAGAVAVAHVRTEDMKELVAEKKRGLRELKSKYGEEVIDVSEDDIYQVPALPAPSTELADEMRVPKREKVTPDR